MPREQRAFRTLLRYFFQRFFEPDLLEGAGDATTTIVRALAIVATPGMMLAFFLQNEYQRRAPWGRIEDHYFFVLYSFLAMAGVAIFEWEMLFPDRLDFLVLSPLPLRRRDLLGAKAGALLVFLGLFLVGSNGFGWWMLPAVSKDHFGSQLVAHGVAVFGAGAFGALTVLAAGGLLLCCLPTRLFRVVSPVIQMLVVAALGLLLVHYLRFGDELEQSLSAPGSSVRLVPTFWFLGVYECLLRGNAAAAFAKPMAHDAAVASSIVSAVALLTYPLAWGRIRRMTLEGGAGVQRRPRGWPGGLITRLVPVQPRRAIVSFIGQTIARNSRYQVYLAMYCGTGLSLAVACAVTLVPAGGGLRAVISQKGLHAVTPLLLFWTIAGLRMAFALPLNLPSRWIFRCTGARRETCISGSRVWAMACGGIMLAGLLLLLWLAGLGGRALLVLAVSGACLCRVLVDCLMFADRGIAFAQPRSPGRTSLPLMLTLYVGVLPMLCIGMVRAETWLEGKPLYLLAVGGLGAGVHVIVVRLRRRSQPELADGDEIEEEFQLLRLEAD